MAHCIERGRIMKYMKEHKGLVLATTLVTLLPILAGVILWGRLPDQMPIHFDVAGEANGWCSKPYAVFVLPIFLAALQIFCLAVMEWDPKKRNIQRKPMAVTLWVIPVVSWLTAFLTYGSALGLSMDVNFLMLLVLGVILTLVGNYLPKCKQTNTMGLRFPWTLRDEENWNYTHRLGGKVWTVGGLAIIGSSFLRNPWIMLVILLVMVLVPAVASYRYEKAHQAEA